MSSHSNFTFYSFQSVLLRSLWLSPRSARIAFTTSLSLVGAGFLQLTQPAQAETFSSSHQPPSPTSALEFSGISNLADLEVEGTPIYETNHAHFSADAHRNHLYLAESPAIAPTQPVAAPSPQPIRKEGSLVLGSPYVRVQGAYLLQGDDSSARGRVTALYPVRPNLLFGAEVDLTTGNAFADSPGGGLSLNELYVAVSPENLPNLRFIGGLMDLTSYFDRNSFAKDSTTHFFNRVFQTNPALSAAGIASRPGVLVNWNATDYLEIKAAAFSASRNLGDFAINSVATEVGVQFGTAIIRGTYVRSKDNGKRSGFEEIFTIPRDGTFGFEFGDREEAYGINAEVYIPSLRVGLFGRYGHYNNLSLGQGGDTYSFGMNALDLFLPRDRLGIGYGRQLSNTDLRRDLGNKIPDVLEAFYDIPILPNLRAGVTLQSRNQFSETVFGFRVKTEFDVVPFRRPFR